MAHLPSRIGSPASPNAVVAIDLTSPMPPLTYLSFLRMLPTSSSAVATCGSLNGMSWLTHWSYTSGPAVRSNTSSSQSVAGQPVASPASMPAHHGLTPVAAIVSERASMSSHVCGTCQPLSENILGEYHTNDFTFAPSGAA